MLSENLCFNFKRIAAAGNDIGGINAGGSVFAVDIKRPVFAIGVVVSGYAVDSLDIQAVFAFVTFDQAEVEQSCTPPLPTAARSSGLSPC